MPKLGLELKLLRPLSEKVSWIGLDGDTFSKTKTSSWILLVAEAGLAWLVFWGGGVKRETK